MFMQLPGPSYLGKKVQFYNIYFFYLLINILKFQDLYLGDIVEKSSSNFEYILAANSGLKFFDNAYLTKYINDNNAELSFKFIK